MTREIHRRRFLQVTASTGLVAGAFRAASAAAPSANGKVALGIMGVNGRGTELARGFAQQNGCEIAYICDVDERAVAKAIEVVKGYQPKAPQGVGDFRKVLDDKAVDALVVATPDHWHAPATILACAAGKHVYVEKPCSHNPHEGELMVAAARKHDRVVALGTQRRSSPVAIEAVEKLRSGAIGRVLYARAWYTNRRPSIGHGKTASIPNWLDYSLWQGPAPEVPYRDNLIHYNWHWFWHWGTGELGNNGVHAVDVCRWGLGVDYPTRVTSGGGKYRHDDDQETPDTQTATFDFDGQSIFCECLSWSPFGMAGTSFGTTFHGDEGTLVINGNDYKILDLKNQEISKGSGSRGDNEHLANFLDCVRSGQRPNADIAEGHKSTLLCQLGNIAFRTNRVLSIDSTNGRIKNDPQAQALWQREYRPGWEPKV